MYARSSFEHSPHRSSCPTSPSQPLLEFRFDSHLHIASPLSTSLPVPYHVRTKSFSFYLASSKSLARLYQKTPGVRTACSISARSKTTAPTSAKSNPCVSYQPPSPNPFVYVSYEKILRATCTIQLRDRVQNRNCTPSPALLQFASHQSPVTNHASPLTNRLPETPVTTQQSLPFRTIDPSHPAP